MNNSPKEEIQEMEPQKVYFIEIILPFDLFRSKSSGFWHAN
ncbi:MAG: hypothetical protein AAF039_14350 [Bacteroidota bacterium]